MANMLLVLNGSLNTPSNGSASNDSMSQTMPKPLIMTIIATPASGRTYLGTTPNESAAHMPRTTESAIAGS